MNFFKSTKGIIVITIAAAVVIITAVAIRGCADRPGSSGSTEPGGVTHDRPGLFNGIFNSDNDSTLDKEKDRRKRVLTKVEREENEREFKLMKEKIPGNMFIPGELSEEEQKERRTFLKDVIILGNKVRKGTATKEEKKKFYELKKKQVSDKIEFAEYIFNRVKEKSEETGREYLDEKTMDDHNEALDKFKEELEKYEKELNDL